MKWQKKKKKYIAHLYAGEGSQMVIAKFSEDFSFSELLLACPGLSPGLEVKGFLGL